MKGKTRGWNSPGNGQGTAYTHRWCGKDQDKQGIIRNNKERKGKSSKKKGRKEQ